MTSKKVLVTGAGGFIGYALANHLAAQGHFVTGVDLRYPHQQAPALFDPQVADIRDWSKMKGWLRGADVVLHLASAHLKTGLDEAEYWDVNARSLRRLLEVVHACDVGKFIHVSSVGVYGKLAAWPADEETACFPQSIYGETKLAGEGAVRAFSEAHAFPAVILRPTWVYGATCPRTRRLYKSLRDRSFVMIGRGDNMRHPIYIADLLEAFNLALDKHVLPGEVFILGGERALTTREVIHTMCRVFQLKAPLLRVPHWVGLWGARSIETGFRHLKREPPVSRRTLEFFDTNNAFDISKARQMLEFTPRFSFEEGLSHCRADLEASA